MVKEGSKNKNIPTTNSKIVPKGKPKTSNKTDAQIDELRKRRIRPTGIAGLDFMLNGGLPTNAIVLLSGDAGVGKTTLAMQWLSAGYRDYGESGIYITMTEPTTVAIRNLQGMSFFDKSYMASSDLRFEDFEGDFASKQGIHFIDFRQVMEDAKLLKENYTYKDLDRLVEILFNLVSSSKAKRVVFDSITAISYLLKDLHLIRSFIFRLGKYLSIVDSNSMLISEAFDNKDSVFGVEEFISDGVIRLTYGDPEKNIARTLKIKKMRGISFNSKKISYDITSDGILMFPPIKKNLNYKVSNERVISGIPGLDVITNGGYIKGTSILVSGPSGSGKTILALQSLVAGLENGEKGIYFSFEESRDQIVKNAKSFGWDLEKYEKNGLLIMFITHPSESFPAEHIKNITDIISDFNPARVVFDSLSAFSNNYSEDIVHEWSTQIMSFVKEHNITTIFISATKDILGSSGVTSSKISSIFDNIIMLRYVEINAEFQHAILVLKMRGSSHDKKLHNLIFSDKGIEVTRSFSGYEGIFSGSAKQVSESIEQQLQSLFLEILGPVGEKIYQEHRDNKGLTLSHITEMVNDFEKEGIISEEQKELFIRESELIFNKK